MAIDVEVLVGTIILWPVPFVPQGWALCDGRLMQVAQYQTLFALIGNYYGGDGRTTFALPDLRDRVPLGSQNPGSIGAKGGNAQVTVNATGSGALSIGVNNLPAHSHNAHFTPGSGSNVSIAVPAVSTGQDSVTPGPGVSLGKISGGPTTKIYSSADPDTTLKPFQVSIPAGGGTVTNDNTGGGQSLPVTVNVPVSFDNRPPYQVLNYIIALEGIFPMRS